MLKIINKVADKFNLSPIKQKMTSNIFWVSIGRFVSIISGLLVGIFVARYLGPEQYGLMSYIISYVSLFSIVSTFGFPGIEVRELAKGEIDKNKIFGTALILRIFFGLITIVAIFITLFIFETDNLAFWLILIYSVTLVFNSLDIIRNYFTAIIRNEYIVKIDIIRTIIGALLKLLILFLHAKLQWFIIVSIIDIALLNLGYLLAYRKENLTLKAWRFDKAFAKYLVKESYPLLFSGMAIVIYQKVDQLMIRNMIDNVAVGQFAVAARFSEIVIFIPTMIIQTISPALVKLHNENKNLYKIKRKLFLDVVIWTSIILSIGTFLVSKILIINLFGNDYAEAVPVLQILAWKSVVVSLTVASGQIIIIEGLQKYAILRNLYGSVINVLLNLLLIPIIGVVGSAFAAIVAISFAGYFSHLFIKPYRFLFYLQTKSLFGGYVSILNLIPKGKIGAGV